MSGDFQVRHLKQRVVTASPERQLEPMIRRGNVFPLLVRGDKAGDKNDLREFMREGHFFGQTQMAQMWRIERSS